MTKSKQKSDIIDAAQTIGKHYAQQHFADNLAAAGDSLLKAMDAAENEIAGYTASETETKQAASHLRTAFREEWERLHAHAISGLKP